MKVRDRLNFHIIIATTSSAFTLRVRLYPTCDHLASEHPLEQLPGTNQSFSIVSNGGSLRLTAARRSGHTATVV